MCFSCVFQKPLSPFYPPFLFSVLCVSPFSVVNKSLRFALCTGWPQGDDKQNRLFSHSVYVPPDCFAGQICNWFQVIQNRPWILDFFRGLLSALLWEMRSAIKCILNRTFCRGIRIKGVHLVQVYDISDVVSGTQWNATWICFEVSGEICKIEFDYRFKVWHRYQCPEKKEAEWIKQFSCDPL